MKIIYTPDDGTQCFKCKGKKNLYHSHYGAYTITTMCNSCEEFDDGNTFHVKIEKTWNKE